MELFIHHDQGRKHYRIECLPTFMLLIVAAISVLASIYAGGRFAELVPVVINTGQIYATSSCGWLIFMAGSFGLFASIGWRCYGVLYQRCFK